MHTDTSLLKRGEHAIAIFTYGKYFYRRRDGSGSTGNWVLDDKRKYSKVVIYNRTESRNDIYVARRTAVKPSREQGRFVLDLDKIHYLGSTYLNWLQFAGSRNPVRYMRVRPFSRKKRANKSQATAMNLELLPASE